jgi:glycerophosphoryl diester phosphodiesterase
MSTKIFAHRGASAYAPENTMEAFRLAYDMSADGLEIDVHLTKDGQVVVIHDHVIDRTSNGKGAVAQMTYEELLAYDFS